MPLIKSFSLFVFLLIQCSVQGQFGCTDPLANNFDPFANENDGSCEYPITTIDAQELVNPMPIALYEQSGMIKFNDQLWIHLDGGNAEDLFAWDIDNSQIDQSLVLQNVINKDWEDIAQDETHIYIGDFGNNVGNRTDLKIYKIAKTDLLDADPEDVTPEIIHFSYPEQTDFSNQNMAHDFDCEAMIVRGNDIFLFTKQWVSNGSSVYKLPISAGTHEAEYSGGLDVQGLVAGADHDPFHDITMLCGYELSGSVNTFSFMLWDYPENDILDGNKRKFTLDWPLYQIEAIAYDQFAQWYIANEYFEIGPVGFYNQLRRINVAEFLTDVIGEEENKEQIGLEVYPNPNYGEIRFSKSVMKFEIYNSLGRVVFSGGQAIGVNLDLLPGIYLIKLYSEQSQVSRKVIVE